MVAGATHSRWSNRSRAPSPSRTTAIPARGARRGKSSAADSPYRNRVPLPDPIACGDRADQPASLRIRIGGRIVHGLTSTAAWTNESISVSAPLCVTFSACATLSSGNAKRRVIGILLRVSSSYVSAKSPAWRIAIIVSGGSAARTAAAICRSGLAVSQGAIPRTGGDYVIRHAYCPSPIGRPT